MPSAVITHDINTVVGIFVKNTNEPDCRIRSVLFSLSPSRKAIFGDCQKATDDNTDQTKDCFNRPVSQ